MHCLLIIGHPADDWADKLGTVTGDDVQIEAARLPSAGIRQFESMPADLLIIADEQGGSRVEILVRALRKRPLGQLVPILLLCPPPEERSKQEAVEALDLVGWHSVQASPETVLSTIEDTLGANLHRADTTDKNSDVPKASPDQKNSGAVSYFDGDIVLEPMDESAPPHRIEHGTAFQNSSLHGDAARQALGADEVKRTLKAVRHEDYYVILDVRRGAEGQTIREAFHRLMARFDPNSLDFQILRKFQDEIDEIRDALEDAFAVLGDPELRQAYLQRTVRR